ncbi:histone deacetylase complex subunit SAP30 homolog [Lepeophtheirus salmonis]|uniref:Histone deacetylase complex subunit SAP30 homolog n=1 Tax=Lepeophtheirus salmonis TaxID=72036 RepID=A0A0K2THL0_LEPSM|nr:histone deacetylase complex subunit SAP30 homolog [Lepeophtheirus salmonis]
MSDRPPYGSTPQQIPQPLEVKTETIREVTVTNMAPTNNINKPESRINGCTPLSSTKIEEDESYWSNGVPSGAPTESKRCCLVENGRRCSKDAGFASYSKRIQKTVTQKKLKLHMDTTAKHIYICDYHKKVIQSLRTKRKTRESDDDSGEADSEVPEVDLYQLQVNTLRRYKKHYKVPIRPGISKAQLAECLMRHFRKIPVVEKEALTFFIYMVKTNKSKLDNNDRRDLEAD